MRATLLNIMGDDLTVCDAARVSFNKKTEDYTEEQNHRLINYLAKHKHYSPFGHCFASFHIKAPIFVARQLVKHEYLRWNEISRRYVDDGPEFYFPETWRGRPVDKKQGSGEELDDSEEWLYETYKVTVEECVETYKYLLDKGVAPEMARMVLPQSMYTEWYWSGSLDAFADMCKLRCKEDTQEETRMIANQISEQMEARFPVSWKALMEN